MSHEACATYLAAKTKELGSEVDVFTEQPKDWGAYEFDRINERLLSTDGSITCPHGQKFWQRPTLAQQQEWFRTKTP